MSGWAKKRFWKETSVEDVAGGFGIALDGRTVKTPAKAALVLPTRAMAEAVAAEWDAQVDEIDPNTMPVTRSANAAIDKVAVQHAEVADMIAEYGGTDLLCYRATSPEELVARQVAGWDPMLDWAAQEFGARLEAVAGVMHHAQEETTLEVLKAAVHELNAFELAAFHDIVGLSGSLILGFAALRGGRDPEEIWRLSQIDEQWQEDQWGADEEATREREIKYEAFLHANRFYKLAQN
ncbi:chaperone required for assembly of F1-ATPase [Shimia isoporae]|uniref:Chaperone required for assembly of F1-ATPase n=1 Tax=Shimia isoporae TaxID=647720 RepID=A0A4V2Q1U0_9RHOB|nr:ATP12 family protein [Shimia isoporae]TCK98881.1 chaperone required for assembly of F1-ATPase [Shimia isoporae]